MNNITIGVIGVGGRGDVANHAHRPRRGAHITAGADPSDKALKKFGKKYPGAALYPDYRELLASDVDAVFICSPDSFHEEHAVAALQAGKAVYLEKPLAITVEGCDRILKAAMESGSKLYLGHNMRHFSSILKMKELIDSGVIGEVKAVWCRHFIDYGGDAYFMDWHSERKNTTGLLLQKGAHDMDVIHWLAGGYSSRVSAMGKLDVYDKGERRDPATAQPPVRFNIKRWPPMEQDNYSPVIDVEDHNMVMMQLDNGVQASYVQCHYTPDSCRNYTFIGTRGRIENIGDTGRCTVQLFGKRTWKYPNPSRRYRIWTSPFGHGGADVKTVKAFLDFVQHGKKPSTSPVAARQAVAAGIMATESLRNGSVPREIPPLPEGVEEYFA